MSQNTIIGVLVAVILAGGGFWYYQTNMADTGGGAGTQKSSSARDEKEGSGGLLGAIGSVTGSFNDIIGRGEAAQCEFSGVDPDTKDPIDGIMYVSGDSYRIEGDTVIDGTAIKLSMIEHENVFYMWSDKPEEMPPFMIDNRELVKMNERDGIPQEKPESPLEWLKDPTAGVEYDCKGWSPRGNSFEPPSDIEFVDVFGEMGAAVQGMFSDPSMLGGGSMDDYGMDGGYDDSSY